MSRTLYPYQAPLQPLYQPTLLGDLEMVSPPDPNKLVLAVDDAKKHCQIYDDSANDTLEGYIRAATRYCERNIVGGRQFLLAQYKLPVQTWWSGSLRLPKPPLVSIDSVSYYDSGGTLRVLDPSIYLVRTPLLLAGTIERAPFKYFPSLQADRNYDVEIVFTCGYGDPPESIKQAMRFLVKFMNENRGELPAEIPSVVQVMLDCESYGSYA